MRNPFKVLIDWILGRREPPESAIVRAVGKDLHKTALGLGKEFTRQVVVEANGLGLPVEVLQYVFFVLVEQQTNWPNLTPDAWKSLTLARDLMVAAGATPRYRSGFQVPPEDYESAVDEVVRRLAVWAQTNLRGGLAQAFVNALKAQKPKMDKLIEQSTDLQEARGRGLVFLKFLVESAAESFPSWFPNPQLDPRIVQVAKG